jgi:ATP-dependent helicase/nuclease subunit B
MHKILLEYSKILSEGDVRITDNNSGWMRLTKLESDELVERLYNIYANPAAISKDRTSKIIGNGNAERYRVLRIKNATKISAWTLAEHVKAGRIDRMLYEERFGRGRRFPAIVRGVEGADIVIEGQIDRVDIMDGRAKIIDYKSGNEYFNIDEARNGWRLQLMLYLQAVTNIQDKNENYPLRPAGVFYFRIKEPQLDCGSWSDLGEGEMADRLSKEIRKSFRMDGLMLDDQEVLAAIAGTDWKGRHYNKQGFSDIAPVKAKTDANESVILVKSHPGSMKLLNEEGFVNFQSEMRDKVDELCLALASGEIEAAPKRTKAATACDYCQYKGICCHER